MEYNFDGGHIRVYQHDNGEESVTINFHKPELVEQRENNGTRWTEYTRGNSRLCVFTP